MFFVTVAPLSLSEPWNRLAEKEKKLWLTKKKLTVVSKKPEDYFFRASAEDFKKIPKSPIAYWVSNDTRVAFYELQPIESVANPRAGLTTGDNTIFQRQWYEVSRRLIKLDTKHINETFDENIKWYPCNSGGDFRKWFGNRSCVVNWQNNGEKIRSFAAPNGRLKASPRSSQFYFRKGVSWSKISSGKFAARSFEEGFILDDTGQSIFANNDEDYSFLISLLCSKTSNYFLTFLSQTLSFNKVEMNLFFDEDSKNQGSGNKPSDNSGCCVVLMAVGSSVAVGLWGFAKLIA